jgi:hypothetical protein
MGRIEGPRRRPLLRSDPMIDACRAREQRGHVRRPQWFANFAQQPEFSFCEIVLAPHALSSTLVTSKPVQTTN